MMTIDRYLDDAKSARDIRSDRELSAFLTNYPTTVSQYRKGRAWPSVERMIRIAELGGHSPEEAIIDLLAWKAAADDHHTKAVIARLREAWRATGRGGGRGAAATVGALALALFVSLAPSMAEAGISYRGTDGKHHADNAERVYIMRNLI